MEKEFRVWNKKTKKMEYQSDLDFLVFPGKKIPEGFKDLEVMQWTGLKDESGKKIYEGDVIEFTYWWFDGNYVDSILTGEIIYDKKFMSYSLKGIKNKEWLQHIGGENNDEPDTSPFAFFNFNDVDFEVKGDVYQNPELLK